MNVFKRAAIRMTAGNKLKEIAQYTKIDKCEDVWVVVIIDPQDRYLFDSGFWKTEEGKKLSKHTRDVLYSIFTGAETGGVWWLDEESECCAGAYRVPVIGKHIGNVKNLTKLATMQQEFARQRRMQRSAAKQR